MGEVSGFHLGADLSASVQRGNTDLVDVAASGMVGVLEGRHWARVIFGGKYLSDDDRSILDQQFVQIRYSWVFSPRLRTFHFVQAQKNETLLLRSRWLLGTGIRRTFLSTERAALAAGTGLMGEWERLDAARVGPGDEARSGALRMANLATARWDFPGGARLLDILYLQPDVTRPDDVRILNDLALLVPLSGWLRATASLEWRRDTRPPSSLARDDLTLRVGLGADVR